MLNKLLAGQVAEHFGEAAKWQEPLRAFLNVASDTYNHYEHTIQMLEIAVETRANELAALHEKLLNETTRLKNANDELTRIFNQVNEGFFSRDIISGRYIQMSVGCEKIYGYTIADFYANPLLWYQVIHPDDKTIVDRDDEILNNGIQVKTCYRIIHKDSGTRWIEVKAIPALVNGKPVRMDGVVNDITESKNAEKSLSDREVKYRSFFENSMDGIMLSKPDGAIEEANPAACEIYRATEAQICGYSRAGLMTFADPELVILMEERSRVGKVKGEVSFRRLDGTKFRAEIASSLFKDANGQERTCIIVRDITERKKAQLALQMNERQLDLIYNNVSDGIFMLSVEAGNRFRFISVNQSFLKSTGLKKDQVIGKYVDEVIPPPSLALVIEKYREAITVKSTISWEEQTTYPSGVKTGIVSVNPVLDDGGDCIRIIGSVHDITGRKKSEQTIREGEEKYRTLVEQASDAIFINTPNGELLDVNKSACDMLGYSKAALIKMNVAELMLPEELTANPLQFKKIQNDEISATERNMLHRNGEIIAVDVSSKLLSDGRIIAIARNVTERRNAEKINREAMERVQRLSQATHDAVWDWNLATEEVWWNDGFFKLFGFDKSLPIPAMQEWTKKIHPDDRDKVVNRLRTVRKNTIDFWEDEFRYEMENGNYGTVLDRAYTLRNEAGQPIRLIGAIVDLTERKKNEQQIAESEQRYRQIVETAQEGIWMADEHYNTSFINKKTGDLLEYTEQEMLGKPVSFFMPEEGAKLLVPSMERRRKGISEDIDMPFITKSGKLIWVNVSVSPILNNEAQFVGVLAMLTDITKRKLDSELIKKSRTILDLKNIELERKNKELEQFAYVASHDLQEPLRTTTGFVKLLQQQYMGRLDDKADKYLRFIIDSSDRMRILINDLLDYSRIGGKHEMEQVDCNIVLENVAADLHKVINDSAAEIITGHLPVINGYPTEIKQLFQNLITNAIKFRAKAVTPQIRISAVKNGGYWHFAFADNGIGIEKAHSERIFIIFQRLHTRSEYPGSGIGLSHCKKIVELHHGKIWVEPAPEGGSVFHFTIAE